LTRNLQQHPLSERIGSLISGVDLGAPLDEATKEALRAVMRERKLLLFREPGLSGGVGVPVVREGRGGAGGADRRPSAP